MKVAGTSPAGWKRRLLALALFFLAWFATGRLATPQQDRSDEPEWTAISLNTTRQLAGGALSGKKRDQRDGRLHGDPWRQGVQATTFGWPNPIFHKLVWGLVCKPLAPARLSPDVFQRYHGGDPARANGAIAKLVPAIERAREVVAFESALCALLLFLIGAHLAGWLAGSGSYLLWLYHPLVRAWSHQARPDFGMLVLLLGCLWAALLGIDALLGKRGKGGLIAISLLLGALAGLCVATKLNGGLAAIFVALVIPLGGLLSRCEPKPGWGVRFAAAGGAGLIILALLFALFPYLWSAPVDHLKEVLAFWSEHMAMQQDRLESFGGVATRTPGERIDLAFHRMGGAEDPLGATLGFAGGLLWVVLGAAGLILSACWSGLRNANVSNGRARIAVGLLWTLVVSVGSVGWLPLNWDRYFFPLVACSVLLEACLIALLIRIPFALQRLETAP